MSPRGNPNSYFADAIIQVGIGFLSGCCLLIDPRIQATDRCPDPVFLVGYKGSPQAIQQFCLSFGPSPRQDRVDLESMHAAITAMIHRLGFIPNFFEKVVTHHDVPTHHELMADLGPMHSPGANDRG